MKIHLNNQGEVLSLFTDEELIRIILDGLVGLHPKKVSPVKVAAAEKTICQINKEAVKAMMAEIGFIQKNFLGDTFIGLSSMHDGEINKSARQEIKELVAHAVREAGENNPLLDSNFNEIVARRVQNTVNELYKVGGILQNAIEKEIQEVLYGYKNSD